MRDLDLPIVEFMQQIEKTTLLSKINLRCGFGRWNNSHLVCNYNI